MIAMECPVLRARPFVFRRHQDHMTEFPITTFRTGWAQSAGGRWRLSSAAAAVVHATGIEARAKRRFADCNLHPSLGGRSRTAALAGADEYPSSSLHQSRATLDRFEKRAARQEITPASAKADSPIRPRILISMNGTSTTKTDETQQIAKYWNDIADDFDAIYTGNKNPIVRGLDRWLRRDIYQRFEWVMREAGPRRLARHEDLRHRMRLWTLCHQPRQTRRPGHRCRLCARDAETGRSACRKRRGLRSLQVRLSDVLDWKTNEQFDLVIAIGFWDYVADPLPRLKVIRGLTKDNVPFRLASCRNPACRHSQGSAESGWLPRVFLHSTEGRRNICSAPGFRVEYA